MDANRWVRCSGNVQSPIHSSPARTSAAVRRVLSHSQAYLTLLLALGWVFLAACESGKSSDSATAPPNPATSMGVANGAAVLSVTMNGVAAQTVYNEALVLNPSGGQQVTAIQADIAVPAGYTRTGNAVASAYVLMEFQPGAYQGTQNHLLRAMAGYTDDGTGSPGAMFMLMECDAGSCQGPPGGVSGTWPIGTNLPMALGSACTFAISVNTATKVFTFSLSSTGCNGGTAVSATVDASGWSSPFPVDVSSTNALANYLLAQIRGGATDGGNGAITASFDNVMVGYGGGAASLFDDFGTGTLDPAKWAVH